VSKHYDIDRIRNIGIAAHIDAGKTTVTERILYYAGKTYKMGEVHEGTAVMDYLPEEQERGITITSAATTFNWLEYTVNLIDTPGHVDFTAEVERSLRVLDGAIIVFDAKEGVEAQSETVWRQADKYNVPRLCFVNKMDKLGADFFASLRSIATRLPANPIAVQIPIGTENEFEGLIDLVTMQAVYWKPETLGKNYEEKEIPAELKDEAEFYHHELVEKVAEVDDHLMDKYLHDQPIDSDELRKGIRTGVLDGTLHPVLCGSALKYQGIHRLLDAVCFYLPSPRDIPPVEGRDPKHRDKAITRKADPSEPFSALVFKIVSDQHGDLNFIRIYSGTLKTSTRVYNPERDVKENVSRIWRMHAKERVREDLVHAGDIVAVSGPKKSFTGDTLCDSRKPITLQQIDFPETVINLAIEPVTAADKDRLALALRTLTREDPTFEHKMDPETGQTIISGMGELHLEILKNKIQRDMKVDVRVGKPRVSYREMVTTTAEAEGRFIRQTGGRGHFAIVELKVEPFTAQAGEENIQIVNAVREGAIPQHYIPAVEEGIRESAKSGVLLGYPVINIRVTIIDGRDHPVDSSDIAFENAASAAFREAVLQARPALLEPIMKLQVTTPEEYFGNVTGDLTVRRAVITGTSQRGNIRVIEAKVPLAEMFGYATTLRSLTQGRANPTDFEPCGYEPVPEELANKILETAY